MKWREFSLALIVIINIIISFWINPVENSLAADHILDTASMESDNTDYVYFVEDQIVYKEADQTCVAYACLDIAGYDYLQVELDAYVGNAQCRIYADISGENTKWDVAERFYAQFYSDVDADHTRAGGTLELGRNHSDTGVIRLMNDAGAPTVIRNIHVSGWKYYKLSNYSILMLLIFSVMIIWRLQKLFIKKINRNFTFIDLIQAGAAFISVNALFGGLVNDAARASNSLTLMLKEISGFLTSDLQYTWIITAFCILYFYVFKQTQKVSLPNYSIASSYVFSFFILSGYLYDTNNVFFELYHQKHFWLICLFMMAGLAQFIQCVMRILHIFMEYVMAHSVMFICSRKKCFLAVWAIITAVWLPHLLIRYPAAIHWDSAVQINRVLQDSIDTTLLWPLVSTLLMGESAQFGKLIFDSYDAGIFLYALMQTIICSAIFAYGISLLLEFHVSRIYIWTAVFICSVMPVFSSFTTSVSKDVPFSNLVMLFLLLLFETVKVKSDISLKYGLLYAAVTVSVILLSNKGIFYVSAGIIGILAGWIIKRETKYWKLFTALTISLFTAQCIQAQLNNIYGNTSHLQVAICQPLQEIGYYSIKHEGELHKEDKELIDRFVIYDDIADSYRMDMADGIFIDIWRTENEHSLKEICRFILLWCRGFIKHPDCYIDATLRCNFGFYYPDIKQWGNYNSGYYLGDPNVPNIELPFTYSDLLRKANIKLSEIILFAEDIPVLYLFNSVAISVWIQVFIFLYLFFKKRWKELFCVLISLISFALCLAGPTYFCGGARYALVSIFFNIFIFGYWISDRYT